MFDNLPPFLLHWAITALSLWVASHLFKGLRFGSTAALVIAALLLGLANAVVRPLLVVLTFPLTLVSFGLFLLAAAVLMANCSAPAVKLPPSTAATNRRSETRSKRLRLIGEAIGYL